MFTTSIKKETILNAISQEEIFKRYCPNFKKINVKFSSEVRDDPKPSCVIAPYNGVLWYKDFGDSNFKAMDCFSYISYKYNISYYKALRLVAGDFFIDTEVLKNPKLNRNNSTNYTKVETSYEFKIRKYSIIDKEYWGDKYGFTPETLKHFNIFPVKSITIKKSDKQPFTITPKRGYVYIISKKYGIYKFLILDDNYPLKWFGNSGITSKDGHVFYEGYEQLPNKGDLLIITKSLKDAGVLYTLGYISFSPNSESVILDDDIVSDLKNRFNRIILFYDNDSPGIKGSTKNSKHHKLEQIFIPIEYNIKDISDFREKYGELKSKELMIDLIKNASYA